MFTKIRGRLTYANVAATLALFLVLAGGAAYATHLEVRSSDIVDDEVRTADVRNDTLTGGGLTAADLRAGSVGSSEVKNGSLRSGDLAAAARGARAWGHVASDGTLAKGKNVADVDRVADGVYCIELAGIDPSDAVLVPGPDFAGNDTNLGDVDLSVVEWDSSASSCPAGRLQVLTFIYDGDTTDDDDGGGNSLGDILDADDEVFTFLVP